MAPEPESNLQFKIGHVSVNEQDAQVAELTETVRLFEQLGETTLNFAP
jgi:hypothetical protein